MGRDKQNAQEEQLSTTCVICNISRERFIQCPGASYALHVAETHHVLSYLNYFLYLKEKEHKENTPQEVYMQNCLRDDNDSIRFFPIEMTADLRNEIKRDREGLMDEKLGTIVEQLG